MVEKMLDDDDLKGRDLTRREIPLLFGAGRGRTHGGLQWQRRYRRAGRDVSDHGGRAAGCETTATEASAATSATEAPTEAPRSTGATAAAVTASLLACIVIPELRKDRTSSIRCLSGATLATSCTPMKRRAFRLFWMSM